jgi:GNAT superfamily N-acetyltransferase
MSALPEGGLAPPGDRARQGGGGAVGAAGDGALTIAAEPFDAPDSRHLIDELMADLEVRYAADVEPGEGNPELSGEQLVTADQVSPPHGVFLVARLDGRPVGCGALRPDRDGRPGLAEIKRMYVVPEARGRGISRALLAALEAEAVALGYRRVRLETGVRQPEAVRLYKSAGYHRIAGYGRYETDLLSLFFAKDLRPA